MQILFKYLYQKNLSNLCFEYNLENYCSFVREGKACVCVVPTSHFHSVSYLLMHLLWVNVADLHHIDADPDADPACHFDPYPNPAWHFDADPDPTFHFDTDQIRILAFK